MNMSFEFSQCISVTICHISFEDNCGNLNLRSFMSKHPGLTDPLIQ